MSTILDVLFSGFRTGHSTDTTRTLERFQQKDNKLCVHKISIVEWFGLEGAFKIIYDLEVEVGHIFPTSH